MTIVMISSELEELRSICDRIAIVDEGRVAGILPPTTSALLHNASTLGISLKSMTDLLPEPEAAATVPERSGE